MPKISIKKKTKKPHSTKSTECESEIKKICSENSFNKFKIERGAFLHLYFCHLTKFGRVQIFLFFI